MGKDLKGKELGKGISQRKNKMYMGRFTNRFGKRITIYNEDLKVLKQELLEAQYKDQVKTNSADDKITLDEWFQKWLSIYKEGEIRKSSMTIYRQYYKNHISPQLGKMKIADISNIHIQSLLKDMQLKKGLSYESCNKARVILSDMFEKAMINDLLIKNPARGIKIKRNEEKEVQVFSTEDQYAFFECAAGTFYSNMFTVQVNTGLRPGELYALKEEDINFDEGYIIVDETLSYQKWEGDEGKTFHFGPPKTESSNRKVPISKNCKLALQKQIIQKRAIMQKTPKDIPEEFKSLLFTTKYGTPLNTQIYSEAIERIINEINLTRFPIDYMEKITPHCFRHTFATRCFESGIDFKIIQKYLGHSSLKMTTDLYVHITDTLAGEELPKLEDKLDLIESMGEEITVNKIKKLQEYDSKIVPIAAPITARSLA